MDRKGLSLVELLIILAAVGILGTIIFSNLGIFSGGQQTEATAQAQSWVRTMYPGKEVGVSCVKMDSDGDGYVSCTIAVPKESGDTEMVAIECAAGWTTNDGCRIPKAKVAL